MWIFGGIIKSYYICLRLNGRFIQWGGNGELVYNPKTNLYNDFDI